MSYGRPLPSSYMNGHLHPQQHLPHGPASVASSVASSVGASYVSGYRPSDAYSGYPTSASVRHNYPADYSSYSVAESDRLQLRRSMSSLQDPAVSRVRQGPIYNRSSPPYGRDSFSRPPGTEVDYSRPDAAGRHENRPGTSMEYSSNHRHRTFIEPQSNPYAPPYLPNGRGGDAAYPRRRPSVSSFADSEATTTTTNMHRQSHISYGIAPSDPSLTSSRPYSSIGTYRPANMHEPPSSKQVYPQDGSHYPHKHARHSSQSSGVGRDPHRNSNMSSLQMDMADMHLANRGQGFRPPLVAGPHPQQHHRRSYPLENNPPPLNNSRDSSAFDAYRHRSYGSATHSRTLSNGVAHTHGNGGNETTAAVPKPNQQNPNYNPIFKKPDTAPTPGTVEGGGYTQVYPLTTSKKDPVQPSLTLPGSIREHSKLVEALLGASSRPADTQHGGGPQVSREAMTSESQDPHGSPTPDGLARNHHETTPTPFSRPISRSTGPGALGVQDHPPSSSTPSTTVRSMGKDAIPPTAPLPQSITTISSTDTHYNRSALIKKPEQLQRVSNEMLDSVARATANGMSAYDCQILKRKIELQQGFIADTMNSWSLE
ncbi:hypothetical protein BSLG_009710 [Batrachochytrium salamandrivorans]|nr:hypothetical protein BSLG_009710 [Batrachochytrium salamandrivorans]